MSQNADSYKWNFGNGDEISVSNSNNQSAVYSLNTSYTITLIAFQQTCSDTTTLTIEIISEPSLLEPNIFTPNNDQINDEFTFSAKNFQSFNYTIFNRWGNIMFEGDLSKPSWNGITKNNEFAGEGTYFYKYSGVGLDGKNLEGQGFFQLTKN